MAFNFGYSTALTGDGLIGLVGAPGYLSDQGSAYIFQASPSNTASPTSQNSITPHMPLILTLLTLIQTGISACFLYDLLD